MTERAEGFRAPRGTYDVLPPLSWDWQALVRLALDLFAAGGYAPVETPTFEHTEIFERGVGQATEVVTKQMYTFEDRGGRSLTLRPEGTAPVIRSVLEHGLERGPLPVKLSYASWMFRQERPQKGRYRQFFQLGIEAIGTDDPRADAEVIEIGMRYLTETGVEPRLMLNSIGHPDQSCRLGYNRSLVEFLERNVGRLAPEDRERVKSNPLRTFDSKEPRTIEVMQDAPLISDHICDACRKHFEIVRGLLDDLAIDYSLEPRLVRGLDYYTRTTFEFVAAGLGSQDAVGGGGRYDGLSESLGGPPLPAIGFALGFDRILMARRPSEKGPGAVDVYVVAIGEAAQPEALRLCTALRRAGIGADLDLMGRSMKGQMKDADRSGARWAAILGEEEMAAREATVRDLESGEQERIPLDQVVRKVSES